MSVKMRQEVERKIATALVKSAFEAGFYVSIDNGGDDETAPLSTSKQVLAQMFQTDDEHLYMWNPTNNQRIGWVWFIYGNDGWDVISDYTVNLEPIMAAANKIADYYEG